jgi:hypothetical protein
MTIAIGDDHGTGYSTGERKKGKMMNEKFEKIDRHLYRRQYQNAASECKTIYYARFVDWQGKRRAFPLGSEIKPAREGLALYEARNVKRENFDADKVKGMTLSEWLKRYLDLVKTSASYPTKQAQCLHLKRILGDLPLTEITRVKIMEYKNRRLSETIIRHGEAVEGAQITGATVNREVSCLITALNLAADQDLCEGAPKVKKEREVARDRILTETDYKAIIEAAPRWLQRVLITANETAIDQGVLLKLTWDCVKDGLIVVKGGRAKTGASLTPIGECSRKAGSRSRRRRSAMPSTRPSLMPRSRIFSFVTFVIVRAPGGRPPVCRSRLARLVSATSCAAFPAATSTYRMIRSAKVFGKCSKEWQPNGNRKKAVPGSDICDRL